MCSSLLPSVLNRIAKLCQRQTTCRPVGGGVRRLLSFAGIWSDLDGDRMIEELYAARHESPPSPPVKP